MTAVTAVVTVHNAAATLDRCLDSLDSAGPFAEVLVVDSGSTDGALEGIEARRPGVRVLKLGGNRGPCATRNLGCAAATTPRVLFLDDDMVLEPGVAAALGTALDETPDGALAGPVIVFDHRPDAIQYAGGRAHFGGLPHLLRLGERPDRARPPEKVDVLTAGCLMADRAAFLEAGGFDEDFFYLAEDVDLSLRLRQRGKHLVLLPHVVVRNIGGTAGLSLKDSAYPARRTELHSRNRWLLLAKRCDALTLFVLLPAFAFYEAAWLLFALRERHLGAYLRGKKRAMGVVIRHWIRRDRAAFKKAVPDRKLFGAPPMTFTQSALSRSTARFGAPILDGVLRLFWTALSGSLR
jgi:N-acetylglucosaminyl-diphospho-decaprenol L-rhamnosyltransferase